jgi:DNA-binding transcriptional ArsR family regulator
VISLSPVNEIAAHFDITQQAVSQHLRVLHGAGLVVEHRAGTRRLYVVRPDGLSDVQAFLDEFGPAKFYGALDG